MLAGEFTASMSSPARSRTTPARRSSPAGAKLEQADLDQFPPGAPGAECKVCMYWWAEGSPPSCRRSRPPVRFGRGAAVSERGPPLRPDDDTRHRSRRSRLRGIVKRFPGVLANDHVDFDLRRGEIHALLGENGAGKSTLMNILAGLYQPDAGARPRSTAGRRRSTRRAMPSRPGSGMVHQHFMLVPSQTVTENMLLGLDQPRFRLRPPRSTSGRSPGSPAQFGLRVDPRAKVWQLSVGEQQRVEILKMLYRGARRPDPGRADRRAGAPGDRGAVPDPARDDRGRPESIVFISHKLERGHRDRRPDHGPAAGPGDRRRHAGRRRHARPSWRG